MLINIASLNVRTFCTVPWADQNFPERGDNESIQSYVERKTTEKVKLIHQYLQLAFDNQQLQGEYLIFTLPEFFWNISPYEYWGVEDVRYFSDYCMNNVSDTVKDIMSQYPQEKYGKIIFLAGTAGTLAQIEYNSKIPCFVAVNYLLCIDNFNISSDGEFNISMWPKLEVSILDYGYNPNNDNIDNKFYAFQVGAGDKKFTIGVLGDKSDNNIAEHVSNGSYGPVFNNDIIPGVPFIIDICADAMDNPDDRQNEWKNYKPILYFFIACGGGDFRQQYANTIQFAIRNDGGAGQYEATLAGGVAVQKVQDGHISGIDIKPIFDVGVPKEEPEFDQTFKIHEIEIQLN